MNREEFQNVYSGELKKFVESDAGQKLFLLLGTLKPPVVPTQHEHMLLDSYAARRGYEQCMSAILALCFPMQRSSEPQVNYGIPDLKTEK